MFRVLGFRFRAYGEGLGHILRARSRSGVKYLPSQVPMHTSSIEQLQLVTAVSLRLAGNCSTSQVKYPCTLQVPIKSSTYAHSNYLSNHEPMRHRSTHPHPNLTNPSKPEARNPGPETRNPKPETPGPEIRTPSTETQSPRRGHLLHGFDGGPLCDAPQRAASADDERRVLPHLAHRHDLLPTTNTRCCVSPSSRAWFFNLPSTLAR